MPNSCPTSPKTIVSTTLDRETLQQLDDFCVKAHLTRSDVLRGLLDSLLVVGRQRIYREWREQVSPLCGRNGEEKVLSALKSCPQYVRAKRLVEMLDGKLSKTSVLHALGLLVAAGKVGKTSRDSALTSGRHSLYFIPE